MTLLVASKSSLNYESLCKNKHFQKIIYDLIINHFSIMLWF